MVKGVAKQAVILHPGDKSGFEQAIFILAPESDSAKVGSPDEMLRLADTIASKYTLESVPVIKKRSYLPYILSFLLGGVLTALGFIVVPMLLI